MDCPATDRRADAVSLEEGEMLLRGASGVELQAEDVMLPGPFQRHEALAYLIDFMEGRGTLHLLRFWLEVQHFSHVQAAPPSPPVPSQADASVGCCCCRQPPAGDAALSRPRFLDLAHPGRRRSPSAMELPREELTAESDASSATESPLPPRLVSNPEMEECALRIFSQYLGLDAADAVQLPVEDADGMRQEVLERMCREDGQLDLDCFRGPQQAAWQLIQSRYFEQFRSSYHFLQYKSQLVLGQHFYLFDILNSPAALPYFLEYTECCGQAYLDALCFLLSGLQFLRHSARDGAGDADVAGVAQVRSDACAIFDKYLSVHKCSAVLADIGIADVVEKSLSGDDCVCAAFRQAVLVVYGYFAQNHLSAFFRSQSFMRFLIDLEVALKVALFEAGFAPSTASGPPEVNGKERGRKLNSAAKSRPVSRMESSDEPVLTRGSRSSIADSSDCGSSIDLSLGVADVFPSTSRNLKKMTLGEVDSLGHFVSFGEKEPAAPVTGSLHFLHRTIRRLKKEEQRRQRDEDAASEAQRIIDDTLQSVQCGRPFD
ncbi:A-kinase anchor protein 10, mitochondrial-like [Paramacrobiotus metropolitanus]|uniref:A-kinase anchor protein 10, mitochondrial-like n=1 Tax=Paramacrobiotus metropolitanus TaxID=2943436 RepID=UPI002445F2AA|nr:A-kinase anchor protein 10, mitochondrial-like [Paramacrobiotus metropolitanus]